MPLLMSCKRSRDSAFDLTSLQAVTEAQTGILTAISNHNASVSGPVPRQEWQKPDETVKCTNCAAPFQRMWRRLNCHQCGKVFCSSCCASSARVTGYVDKVRVCTRCALDLSQTKPPTSSSSSTYLWNMLPRLSASSADADVQKQPTLRPHVRQADGSNMSAASTTPPELSDALTICCTFVSFLSSSYFEESTDPDAVWRTAEIDALIKELHLERKREMVVDFMRRADVSVLPMVTFFRGGGAGGSGQILLTLISFTLKHNKEYDARARAVVCKLASFIGISRRQLEFIESEVARQAQLAAEPSARLREEIEATRKREKLSRNIKIGTGAVVGGVLIGVTAGLAAPLVALGATTAFGASAGAALAGTTGVATLGTLFGARGAQLVGRKVNNRYGELTEFQFLRVVNEEHSELSLLISVPGWVSTDPALSQYVHKDYVLPVASVDGVREAYTVVWESAKLYALSTAVTAFAKKQLWSKAKGAVIHATVFAGMLAALAVPTALMSASDIIDNPWGVCIEAANAGGVELANTLVQRAQGPRPVTLVGYSMGAVLIVSALRELARRPEGRGVVQNVYLFGAPVSGKNALWDQIAPMVSDKIFNFRSENDWFLKLMLRGLAVETCVAGLEGVNHTRVINVDVSALIRAHTEWPQKMPQLLQIAGLSTRYSKRPFVGNVGDRVRVDGRGFGILRFHGWIHQHELIHKKWPVPLKTPKTSRREWFGVALDNPLGDTDGSLEFGQHFECEPGHGVFVPCDGGVVELAERHSHPSSCYSSTCQQQKSDAKGPVALSTCYSAQCRTDLRSEAKLSARPSNNDTVDNEEEADGIWGFGRLLRVQRDLAAAGVDDGRLELLPSVDVLNTATVRVVKCNTPLLSPAVYTIKLTTASSEGSGSDWVIERTFFQLQALNDMLLAKLETPYSRVPFPKGHFLTATQRAPLVEAWLQSAVCQIPRVVEDSVPQVAILIGAELPTDLNSPARGSEFTTLSTEDGLAGRSSSVVAPGARCVVEGRGLGTVRYFGEVRGKLRVGVELDEERGLNDGAVDDERFFTCQKLHGVFAAPHRVVVL
eukprot:m.216259 g.216259  ORF g.216259 m.216259 type:complete len:1062 (-) comp15545_c0_seq16:3000-6185(-)